MNKTIIKEMKQHADYHLRNAPSPDISLQAIQAYAALCQAEATERMADATERMAGCRICGSQSGQHDGAQHEKYAREMYKFNRSQHFDDANNRGDQSIADAIGEQVTDSSDEPLQQRKLGVDYVVHKRAISTAWQ